jgi:L-fucose mutarotase/ribose pyranase (RbsD/FucU family)
MGTELLQAICNCSRSIVRRNRFIDGSGSGRQLQSEIWKQYTKILKNTVKIRYRISRRFAFYEEQKPHSQYWLGDEALYANISLK